MLLCGGEYIRYNAWDNTALYGRTEGNTLSLNLLPSEACVYVFEEHAGQVNDISRDYESKPLDVVWKISISEDDKSFEEFNTTDVLYNLARKMPTFCGIVRYEASVKLDRLPEKISLGNVGEIATLYVNDKCCGDSLFVPFAFDVKDKCVVGENKITVDVVTNLGYRERDSASTYHSLLAMGLTGPVELKF